MAKPYLLILPVFLLACGVSSTLPTPTAQVLTQTPVITTSAPEVLTATPETRLVCADNVNAREVKPDMTLGVVKILKRGDVVTLTGEKFRVGAEVWQPTSAGIVDPQFLCE